MCYNFFWHGIAGINSETNTQDNTETVETECCGQFRSAYKITAVVKTEMCVSWVKNNVLKVSTARVTDNRGLKIVFKQPRVNKRVPLGIRWLSVTLWPLHSRSVYSQTGQFQRIHLSWCLWPLSKLIPKYLPHRQHRLLSGSVDREMLVWVAWTEWGVTLRMKGRVRQ